MAVSIIGGVLGLPLFLDWVRDQYERLDPAIHPHETIDTSSFEIPFNVTNNSAWVSMDNVAVNCEIDLFYFTDMDNDTGILRDAVFSTGTISIPHNKLIQYHCDASRFVHLQSDGSLVIGFPSGQSMKTPPAAFRPPFTIVKMCVWVSGDYKIFGVVPHHFTAGMFQWPVEPNIHQWVEGTIASDDDNDKWIPEGSKLRGAWGLRTIVDKDRKFVPGALRCTPIP